MDRPVQPGQALDVELLDGDQVLATDQPKRSPASVAEPLPGNTPVPGGAGVHGGDGKPALGIDVERRGVAATTVSCGCTPSRVSDAAP